MTTSPHPLAEVIASLKFLSTYHGSASEHDVGGVCKKVNEIAEKSLAALEAFAEKDREPDYWYCDIDPDEGGESAYEAMHGYRQRLTPVELHTNYIGPTKWGVITQKEIGPADSDGEEEAFVFDSEEEAKRFCDERIAAKAQIPKQDGGK